MGEMKRMSEEGEGNNSVQRGGGGPPDVADIFLVEVTEVSPESVDTGKHFLSDFKIKS